LLGFAVESKALDDSEPEALYYVPAVKAANNTEGLAAWHTAKTNMPKLRALFSFLGCPTEFYGTVMESVDHRAVGGGGSQAAARSAEEAKWMAAERLKAVNKQKATKYANDKATSRLDKIEKRIQNRKAKPKPARNSEEPWEAQLARLAAYKRQHGDCNVPLGWAEDPKLGNWADRQRTGKRKLDRGDPGLGMTAARAKLALLHDEVRILIFDDPAEL
jgi:hypothetical protein